MRGWVPLLVGALMVPASVTAFGFTVYGEELETALSSSPAVPAVPRGPVPVSDFVSPVRMEPAAPILVSAVVAQRNVRELFSSHAVKGITFAPGTSSLVGRGEDVRRGLASLLRNVAGGSVTLVSHAWNGETESHRCDVLAMQRAGLVRDYLAAQGVDSVITTRVIVDPVWGPPSDGGPQVDVLVV
jgi:outer membrane protein OmpA-like peptidoglycan-associated protein